MGKKQEKNESKNVAKNIIVKNPVTQSRQSARNKTRIIEQNKLEKTVKTINKIVSKKSSKSPGKGKRKANVKSKAKKNITRKEIQDVEMEVINQSQSIEENIEMVNPSNEPLIEILIEKNGAIIDKYIPNSENFHVVLDSKRIFNSKAFACTLNYSNIAHNNNKFYIIQLIQEDNTENYFIFLRWGRVGLKGQTNMLHMKDLNDGIDFFLTKYQGKRDYGYEEIQLDYSSIEPIKKESAKEEQIHDSIAIDNDSNDNQVIELIKLIFNINIMNNQMKEIGYDSTRLPLGKLSKENIIDGYVILKEIEAILHHKKKGNLAVLTSKFYTKIPHNFGFQNLYCFIINTLDILKEKIEMLESLKDINIATKIIDEGLNGSSEKIPSEKEVIEETYYKQLNCTIIHLKPKSPVYEIISQYLSASSALNSNSTLVLMNAFELNKNEEESKYDDSIGNRKLLWFGTRISNYVSLLKQGFRIAPPEVPSSGFPFGKGIYFTDMSAKAACSCFPSNEIGLLLLCEVSLGKCHELTQTDSALPMTLPEGMNSVKGCGMNVPDNETLFEGVSIPLGKPIKSDKRTWLGFNEYIVYNTNQIKMKYLLKVKFCH